MVVPRLRGAGSRRWISPPSISIMPPTVSSSQRLMHLTRLTEAMLARASPRNPKLPTCMMSAAEAILLVAWRSKARGSSRKGMP